MCDQFSFNPEPDEEGLYHLICPLCKVEDAEGVSLELLVVLAQRGMSSLCVDCSEDAAETIPYWPNGVPKPDVLEFMCKVWDKLTPGQMQEFAAFVRYLLWAEAHPYTEPVTEAR